jgi:hypothetical protein
VNFPSISSNIPAAYGYLVHVCICQLKRYSRACDFYHDVIDGILLLTRRLLNQNCPVASKILQLPMQSVSKVVSTNLTQSEVYSIQFCQWLATSLWFSPGIPASSINKTGRHDITEISLNVALNTISLTLLMKIARLMIKANAILKYICTWWMSSQKRVVCTKFNIYVFINQIIIRTI